ncbi:hypothetical protein [Paenisporosarcina sp. NPDC076898]|uniref:hypothetical protein n=1 Tax=unclassified Paenisporosarcina TaxID=2642018 RepID=UPI003CFC5A7B
MNDVIQAYQSLFPFRQGTKSIETIDQLKDSIRIELLDELTHPRVRKSPAEKLQIAIDRIEKSAIDLPEKVKLKEVYEDVYQTVNS